MNRLLIVIVLLCISGGVVIAEESRPNILLIVSEDNGPEIACYGDPYARTPILDRLASEGVLFNRAFVAQAGCSQSRASYLTGLYPHQHGQIGLATWGFRMYRDDTPNLPRSLKAIGYRTGIVGKLHINPKSAFPFDFHEMDEGNFARKNLGNYARFAKKFISDGEQPFFLSVNYPDAHDPWLRQVDGLPTSPLVGADVKAMPYFGIDPPEMREMVADYYNCLSRLDSLIGDLLTVLQDSGKADNTIVVYLGDHGADMVRGKRTSYEGGVRIPLIVRWPGKAKPHMSEKLVSTVDLMPTLLEAAGADPLAGLPGRDLRPLLSGEQTPWRTHLFTEFHTHAAEQNFFPQRTVRTDRIKLIENLLPDTVNPGYAFTLTKKGKEELKGIEPAIAIAPPEVRAAYALMRQPPQYELYDLENDPFEFRNLAAETEHAAIFAELKQQLAAWRQRTRDPLLDETNLQRLKKEMVGLTKQEAKKRGWRYPEYFFEKQPTGDLQNQK